MVPKPKADIKGKIEDLIFFFYSCGSSSLDQGSFCSTMWLRGIWGAAIALGLRSTDGCSFFVHSSTLYIASVQFRPVADIGFSWFGHV
jgi:hypothetical protein